jgi:hypothetical protein
MHTPELADGYIIGFDWYSIVGGWEKRMVNMLRNVVEISMNGIYNYSSGDNNV